MTDGPFLWRGASGDVLLGWSSFTDAGYAIGVARSASGLVTGPWMHEPEPLVEGGGHAMLVRDAYGFNAGAFGELIRPFRAYLDLGDVERSASRVRTPPSGAPPQPPEASA